MYCVMLIHMLFYFYVSIWFPCLMLALVWPSMHDLWFFRCWKMSLEHRTKIECLMELVSRDRTWFISNIKTLDLNAWFHLLSIKGIGTWWVIIDSKSLGIGFEYSYELILSWNWNWDVCEGLSCSFLRLLNMVWVD